MFRTMMAVLAALLLAGACSAADLTEYDVDVTLTNDHDKDFTDLPVLLQVFRVFGRGVDYSKFNPKGFHVLGEKGEELPFSIRPLPPAFSLANDQIVLTLPKLAKGQTLKLRFTNTKQNNPKEVPFDAVKLAANANNLVANGGFEAGAENWQGGKIVTDTVRSGKNALLVEVPGAGGTATVQCGKPISFVKDKNYYFGVWARCENVTRRTWRYHMPWALQGISARITLSGSPLLFPEHDPNFDKNYLIRLMDDRDWFCYEANALSTLCTPRPALNTVSSTLALTINQENMPYLDAGKPARVWLDEILAFEQPQVQISWERISKKLVPDGFFFYRRAATCLNPSLYDLPQLDAPRPYERIEKISDTAAQAERKTLTLGIHTSKAIAGLQLDVSDLKGPNGAVLGEKQREIEFTYVPSQNFKSDGNGLEGWVIDGNAPREIDRPGYVDYLISFYVPADAAPGKYAGTIKVKGNGTELGSVPVELEIANLRLKPVTEQFAGLIYNAGCGPERLGVEAPWKDANWLKYYSRCNFSYMMNFCQFVPFKGESHEVDIPALVAAVKEVRDLGGCTAGVGLYADCSLDKMGNNNGPEGGRGLWTRSGRNPDVYRARVKEMNDALTKESLPKLMYMIYDEPRFCDPAKFGILKDVPGAVTTSDINFRECLESMEKGLFTHAAVDGPGCDYGPAFRKFATKCNVKTGWDTQFGPLCNRYQTGLMLSNGASIISCWHAAYYIAWHSKLKCYVRNQSIVGAGEGMIDFRYFLTLQESIAEAKKKNAAKAEVEAAEKYIKEIQSFCGDDFHFMGAIEIFTYNGSPEVWGDDWFYDRWRSEMRRHTLAINAKLSGAAAKPQNGPKTAGR